LTEGVFDLRFRSRRVFRPAAILILVGLGAIGIRLCPDPGLPPQTDETARGTPGEAAGPSDRPAGSEGATGDLEASTANPAPSDTPHGHELGYSPLAEFRFPAEHEQVENSILRGTFDVFEFPAGEYDILILTELRAEDSRAVPFSASFKSVEMRRGFVAGPLIAHLQEGIRSGFELD
jgi:hypothetical protein